MKKALLFLSIFIICLSIAYAQEDIVFRPLHRVHPQFWGFSERGYRAEISQRTPRTPFSLRVYFQDLPSPEFAAQIVLEQVREKSRDDAFQDPSVVIVGTAWYIDDGFNPPVKINFTAAYGAYVWVARERRIFAFPEYLRLLRRDREAREREERARRRGVVQES